MVREVLTLDFADISHVSRSNTGNSTSRKERNMSIWDIWTTTSGYSGAVRPLSTYDDFCMVSQAATNECKHVFESQTVFSIIPLRLLDYVGAFWI